MEVRSPDLACFIVSFQLVQTSCPLRRLKEALRRKGQPGREAELTKTTHTLFSMCQARVLVEGNKEEEA